MKGKLKTVLGITGVLATGITIGLLIAPRKGKKTRRWIRNAASDYMERLNNILYSRARLSEDVEEKSLNI